MKLTIPIKIWYNNTKEVGKNNYYMFNVRSKPTVYESYYFQIHFKKYTYVYYLLQIDCDPKLGFIITKAFFCNS